MIVKATSGPVSVEAHKRTFAPTATILLLRDPVDQIAVLDGESFRDLLAQHAMFDVWLTPIGEEDRRELRADIRSEVDLAKAELELRGCAAADYRLSGEMNDLGHICSKHLLRDWRMLVAFPAPDEVCILLIGRNQRGARSLYRRLYLLLEIDEPVDERDKPPCCTEDGEPTLDYELVERLIRAANRRRRR